MDSLKIKRPTCVPPITLSIILIFAICDNALAGPRSGAPGLSDKEEEYKYITETSKYVGFEYCLFDGMVCNRSSEFCSPYTKTCEPSFSAHNFKTNDEKELYCSEHAEDESTKTWKRNNCVYYLGTLVVKAYSQLTPQSQEKLRNLLTANVPEAQKILPKDVEKDWMKEIDRQQRKIDLQMKYMIQQLDLNRSQTRTNTVLISIFGLAITVTMVVGLYMFWKTKTNHQAGGGKDYEKLNSGLHDTEDGAKTHNRGARSLMGNQAAGQALQVITRSANATSGDDADRE